MGVVAELAEDPGAEELREHVRSQLSGFKVPDTVTFSDELPRTATGKVRKNLLRN